jgi:hypothetical protein
LSSLLDVAPQAKAPEQEGVIQ